MNIGPVTILSSPWQCAAANTLWRGLNLIGNNLGEVPWWSIDDSGKIMRLWGFVIVNNTALGGRTLGSDLRGSK